MNQPQISQREQTAAEELANTLTHGVGVLLSVASVSLLVVLAALRRDPWVTTASAIYGATLILLYTVSTAYHRVRSPRAKKIWNILDHGAIYLLVAGTYTPFTLGTLRRVSGWGWSLFGAIWLLALIGIIFQALHIHRFRVLSLASYLGMGWLAVVAIRPLWAQLSLWGVSGIVLGGLFYSVGVIFYGWKEMKFAHAIWHVFVLLGSMAHFFTILFFVVLS